MGPEKKNLKSLVAYFKTFVMFEIHFKTIESPFMTLRMIFTFHYWWSGNKFNLSLIEKVKCLLRKQKKYYSWTRQSSLNKEASYVIRVYFCSFSYFLIIFHSCDAHIIRIVHSNWQFIKRSPHYPNFRLGNHKCDWFRIPKKVQVQTINGT